jgi:hypothetical protein
MAATLAGLAALSLNALADPQDARSSSWALSSERSSWSDDRETVRALAPAGVFGAEIGWLKGSDLRPGSGLQLGLAQSWALRADWDRQRPMTVQVREPVDTFLLGLQYRFR